RHDAHLVPPPLLEIARHLGLAGAEPMEEALKRGAMHSLIGERHGQELVERVRGLGTEPRQGGAPSAASAQHVGEELVGRGEIDARQQLRELARGMCEKQILSGAAAKLRPELSLATMGESKKLLVIETEERPFEHGR